MRKIVTAISSLVVASSLTFGSATEAFGFEGQRSFMPPNELHTQMLSGGITEAEFNAVIDRALSIYQPIFRQFGATLSVDRLWSDTTVNASADQPSATSWQVHMYGGLARRPEVTADGFAMVLCHEIGHHLGGYPYVQDWAANEGQSDMHAVGACAAKMFVANPHLSAQALANLPQNMKDKCDRNRPANERDLCYRTLEAGKSLADLLAALGNSTVNFDTPDTSTVTRTNNDHPAAQCRLDTYVAGAMCGSAKWDYALIPGKALVHKSMAAQNEAFSHSCATGEGARPACWFAALTSDPAPGGDCPLGDPAICALACQLQPSLPWCN